MKKRSKQHARATYFLTFVAVSLLVYSFVNASPFLLVRTSKEMLANAVVGMSAGIPANSDNTLARALAAKEAELVAREAALQGLAAPQTDAAIGTTTLLSFGMSCILFVLLALNYFLDVRRARRSPSRETTVVVS